MVNINVAELQKEKNFKYIASKNSARRLAIIGYIDSAVAFQCSAAADFVSWQFAP